MCLLGQFTRRGLAQLPALVLLLDNAYELLHVDVLPGVCVNKVQLARDVLVSELISGLRE